MDTFFLAVKSKWCNGEGEHMHLGRVRLSAVFPDNELCNLLITDP